MPGARGGAFVGLVSKAPLVPAEAREWTRGGGTGVGVRTRVGAIGATGAELQRDELA